MDNFMKDAIEIGMISLAYFFYGLYVLRKRIKSNAYNAFLIYQDIFYLVAILAIGIVCILSLYLKIVPMW